MEQGAPDQEQVEQARKQYDQVSRDYGSAASLRDSLAEQRRQALRSVLAKADRIPLLASLWGWSDLTDREKAEVLRAPDRTLQAEKAAE